MGSVENRFNLCLDMNVLSFNTMILQAMPFIYSTATVNTWDDYWLNFIDSFMIYEIFRILYLYICGFEMQFLHLFWKFRTKLRGGGLAKAIQDCTFYPIDLYIG